MSLTQGTFAKNRTNRTSKYRSPPKTLIDTNLENLLTKTAFLKQQKSNIHTNYERDTLSRSHLNLNIISSKLRNRKSLNRRGINHNSKIQLNSRGHNYVKDKYINSGATKDTRYSNAKSNLDLKTPQQSNRYRSHSGKFSKSKSNLKNYLDAKNSQMKNGKKFQYMNRSRLNTSGSLALNSGEKHLRYDSNKKMIESKYIHRTQVYDSSNRKQTSPFDEDTAELKKTMEKSNQLFKSLEMNLGDSNRRGLSEKRSNVARKYNKLNLASIQEKVQLSNLANNELLGSTARYLEKRTNPKVYNSGETSSVDSKDYDRESSSSLTLSYGNLENSKHSFFLKNFTQFILILLLTVGRFG